LVGEILAEVIVDEGSEGDAAQPNMNTALNRGASANAECLIFIVLNSFRENVRYT
jgi:hypothetical protein